MAPRIKQCASYASLRRPKNPNRYKTRSTCVSATNTFRSSVLKFKIDAAILGPTPFKACSHRRLSSTGISRRKWRSKSGQVLATALRASRNCRAFLSGWFTSPIVVSMVSAEASATFCNFENVAISRKYARRDTASLVRLLINESTSCSTGSSLGWSSSSPKWERRQLHISAISDRAPNSSDICIEAY